MHEMYIQSPHTSLFAYGQVNLFEYNSVKTRTNEEYMLRNLGISLVVVAIILAILHFFIGFHTKLGEISVYFLGAHASYAAGSFIVEFILYLVFFFMGTWGLALVAGSSKT
jgi:hypothetical protein